MNAITVDRGGIEAQGGEIAAKKNEHHFSLTQFLDGQPRGYGGRIESGASASPMCLYVRYTSDLSQRVPPIYLYNSATSTR